MTCDQCGGTGTVHGIGVGNGSKPISIDCYYCDGTGAIPAKSLIWRARGRVITDWLQRNQLTLREASRRLCVDVAYLSKASRGIIKPNTMISRIRKYDREERS